MNLDFFQLYTVTEVNNINFNNIFLSSELVHNTSECQNVIQPNPVALKAITEALAQTIEPMFLRLTTEVTSMREEIKSLRNEVKGLKKETLLKFVMPDNAFKDLDDFLKFEKQLEDDKNFFLSFGTELLSVAKAPNFTKNCWRKILTDQVAEKLC